MPPPLPYAPSMTPVTFGGELVSPPTKPNTFEMLLEYLRGDNISMDSHVAQVLKLLFVLFQ